MQRLKSILKDSIKTGASHLVLRENGVPTLHKGEREKVLTEHGGLEKAWLSGIAKVLFPSGYEALGKGEPQKDKLSIAKVGELLLLAENRGELVITVYFPPEGVKLFEKRWAEVQKPAAPSSAEEKPEEKREAFEKPQTIGFVPSADFFAQPEEGFEGSDGSLAPLDLPLSLNKEATELPLSPIEESRGGEASLAPLELPLSLNKESEKELLLSLDEELTIDFSVEIKGGVARGTGSLAIDQLLKTMVSKRASDLHLTCGLQIAFRIDGDIVRDSQGKILTPSDLETLLLPITPAFKRSQFGQSWDADFAYELAEIGRFRVNLFRDNHGVGAVFRHIPEKILTLEELKVPEAIRKFCTMAKGLVLVTGPTGSGKSTTQASMIDYINETRHEHMITIEDPIEFVHKQKKCLINQREVGKHTESFSQALRAALREDPDIILVGELRDLETTSIALETAETGHLVFGTLHTNTAISTIDRVIDQYPTEQQRIIRNMLASSLRGVVTQTLCKKKGGGRCAAYEILVSDDAVAAMIREGKNHMIPSQMQTQKASGNCLLNESLSKLVSEGLVDYEEAWKKSMNRKEFEEMFKKRGGSRAA